MRGCFHVLVTYLMKKTIIIRFASAAISVHASTSNSDLDVLRQHKILVSLSAIGPKQKK